MVSIITINYNGYKDTCELIESLNQFETTPFEVIVVDNASLNGDGEKLKEKNYPHVTVVCSETNLGFAGGNNLGYQYAKGEYILYMNNDMTIDKPFLLPLIERLESPSVGIVSPKLKYEYAKNIIQYAGYQPMDMIRIKNHMIGVGQQDAECFNIPQQTPFVHGACMMTTRAVIEKAGLMTDIYFLFYEELDWSIQVRSAGYEIWYEPAAFVYHKESMTIKRSTPFRQYYLTRSRLIFAYRNNKGINRFLSCFYQLSISLPKNLLSCFIRRKWKMAFAYWNGTISGLKFIWQKL